jgi:hypothetical protein
MPEPFCCGYAPCRRLLRWQHPGTMPSRHAFESICAALEPYATQTRTLWAASCVVLRPGKVDTALGPRDAGPILAALHAPMLAQVPPDMPGMHACRGFVTMHCRRHAGGPSVDMQLVTFSDLPQSAFLLVRQVLDL